MAWWICWLQIMLQRGRLGDRGGGSRSRSRPALASGFNGAASVTEAEDGDAGLQSPRRVASTGPPR